MGRRSQESLRLGLLALAVCAPVAQDVGSCSSKVKIPEKHPETALTYNGLELPDICFMRPGPFNVFAVGDWGGLTYAPHMPPVPADKRSKLFPGFSRKFVRGVDDRAQLRVAAEMRARAQVAPPDYILNVGDNFYWGGLLGKCGQPPVQQNASKQWLHVFEQVYWGPGLDEKPWFSVLGNHDYGGYKFTAAWENTIGYTWGGGEGNTHRWVQPALYFSQKVIYPGFSVLYLFIDSNAFEAWAPDMNPSHNICGKMHNGEEATCGAGGPPDITSCRDWFYKIWDEQLAWTENLLSQTTATYQVVVTHFPPEWGKEAWPCIAERHGIDLFVSGHVHKQRIWGANEPGNKLQGTCTIITGGGGGITSEEDPTLHGFDDSYGFVHLTWSKQKLLMEAISHKGIMRKVVECSNRMPVPGEPCTGKRTGRRLEVGTEAFV